MGFVLRVPFPPDFGGNRFRTTTTDEHGYDGCDGKPRRMALLQPRWGCACFRVAIPKVGRFAANPGLDDGIPSGFGTLVPVFDGIRHGPTARKCHPAIEYKVSPMY